MLLDDGLQLFFRHAALEFAKAFFLCSCFACAELEVRKELEINRTDVVDDLVLDEIGQKSWIRVKHGFQIVQRLGAVQHGERIVVVQPSVEDIVDEIVEEGAVDFQLFDFQLAERGGELQIRRTFFRELAQRVHDAFAEFGDVFLLEAGRADGEDDLRRFRFEA